MVCDLACVIANQGTLYIAAVVPIAAVMFLVMKVFTGMDLGGIGIFIGFIVSLVGESLAQLLPWFITIPVIAVSSFVMFQNRRRKR